MTLDAPSTRPVAVSPHEPMVLRLGVVALGGLGGSGRVAWDIAQGLAARGHRVLRLTSLEPHWSVEPHGVVTSSSPNVPSAPRRAHVEWVTALASDIRDAVVQHELEALSVHYGIGLVEAAVAARKALASSSGLRIYATLHGTDIGTARSDPEQRVRLAESLEQCDGVTAVSNWLADEAVEVLGLRVRPKVIRNAVDVDLFRPPLRKPPLPLTLLHASNFRAVKRPVDCVDVLARVRADGLDARLVMTGEGPLRAAARARTEILDVRPYVEFRDPVDRATLAGQFQQAHVCLVTSEAESFGLVALEAMACGVPFVGTQCGGLQELLEAIPGDDLSPVLLAPPGDIDGLADRVRSLWLDQARYEAVRQRCLGAARQFDRANQLLAYGDLFAGAGDRS